MDKGRTVTSIKDCLAWVKETQQKLQEQELTRNYLAIKQSLEDLKEINNEIKEFQEIVEGLKKTRNHLPEVRELEGSYLLLQDMALQKKRCLEMLLFVTETENLYQNLEGEIEKRATYLSHREVVFDSVYRTPDMELSARLHKDCVYAVRDSWEWLSRISRCLELHLQHASSYHQFFHDVRYIDADMEQFIAWLYSASFRSVTDSAKSDELVKLIRDITGRLLQYQTRVERLQTEALEIFPILLRRKEIAHPIRATVLVNYDNKDIRLEESESCSILDNSDAEKWRVRKNNGTEGNIPAIIAVIPPPDREAVRDGRRVLEQVAVHYNSAAKVLRLYIRAFIDKFAKGTRLKQYEDLTAHQRGDLMNLVNLALDVLCDKEESSEEQQNFLETMTSVRRVISQISAEPRVQSDSKAFKDWKSVEKIILVLQELMTYAKAHNDATESTKGSVGIAVKEDKRQPLEYSSRAYFERTKPVEIVYATETQIITNKRIRSDLYIHERHRGSGRSGSQKRKTDSQKLSVLGEQMAEDTASMVSTQESKSFVITGVINPTNGEVISLQDAVRLKIINRSDGMFINPDTLETMPLSQAINMGLLQYKRSDSVANGDARSGSMMVLSGTLDTRTCSVGGVIDPRTGETITMKDAIVNGILDPQTGEFSNPITGHRMTLAEAIQNGFVVLDSKVANEINLEQDSLSLEFSETTLLMSAVIDPKTNKEISLRRAVKHGLVDLDKGVYYHPLSGEELTLVEAIECGLIKAEHVPDDTKGDNVIILSDVKLKAERILETGHDMCDGEPVRDVNSMILERLRTIADPDLIGILDPKTGESLTIEEAFEKGVISLGEAIYTSDTGQTLPILEAAIQGYINTNALKDMLKVYQEHSLGQLEESGALDTETGLFRNPETGKYISLQSAIEQGFVDPETVFFHDIPSGQLISLSEAIQSGKLDQVTGKYLGPNGEYLTIQEAMDSRILDASVNPDKLCKNVETLSKLRPLMNTLTKGVYSPYRDCLVSTEEAVRSTIIDLPHGRYIDDVNAERNPLIEAIKANKIESQLGTELLGAINKMSLDEAIESGKLDPRTGLWLDESTGNKMSLAQAIGKGVINPNFVYVVDGESGQIMSLGACIESGKFSPQTGRFLDPETGRKLTIKAAIEKGLILSSIDPERCLDDSSNLKELIDRGKVNANNIFVAPNGQEMSLRDAMANGFLTLDSRVSLDPETGKVLLNSDEDIVNALLETKELSEWLDDIEHALALQNKLPERLEMFQETIHDHAKLKEEINSRDPILKAAIAQARELIDNNKSLLKEKGGQQYQKLKQNVTDLGVRFEAAQSEADARGKFLDLMYSDLEAVHDKGDSLEEWMEKTKEKSRSVLHAPNGIDLQYEECQALADQIRDKEEDLSEISQLMSAYNDECQEFQKGINGYRKALQLSPRKPPRQLSQSTLEERQHDLDSKFKEISAESLKQLEVLSDVIKDKTDFDKVSKNLDRFYPDMEDQLIRDIGTNRNLTQDKAAREILKLKDAKVQLLGQEEALQNLSEVTGRLADGLIGLNRINDASDVKKKLRDHQTRQKNLEEMVDERQDELSNLLSHSQDASDRLDGVFGWLAHAETKLQSDHVNSADKDTLVQQIQEQRLIKSEIAAQKSELDRLEKDAKGVPGMASKISEARERLQQLEHDADERLKDLEAASSDLESLQSNARKIGTWLDEAVSSLHGKMRTGDRNAVKSKVDELCDQKKEKESSMQVLKDMCTKLVEDPQVTDTHAPKQIVADVQSKWHELTELLVQQVSLEALTEIDGMLRYLDKAENEINTAEPISIEPDTLTVQLREHNAFNEDLHDKRNAVKEIINKCNKMLRETTNEQTDEIKTRLDSICTQADIVCQLSEERLHQLEAALPLASHFSENQGELAAWLDEMEAELRAQGSSGENLEQVKKQLDNLKGTQQIIEDHKPFIEDLNTTSMELMEICGDEDAVAVQETVYKINVRYDELKKAAKQTAEELDETRTQMTQEVSESIETLLEDVYQLNRQIEQADPVPANPDKLSDEIEENKAIMEETTKKQPFIEAARESLSTLEHHNVEEADDVEELKSKLEEINKLTEQIQSTGEVRGRTLNEALGVSERFYNLSTDVTSNLRDLKDNIFSQEPPGVDPPTVKEQIKELQDMKHDLVKSQDGVEDCRKIGEYLTSMCGETGKIEVRKQVEDVEALLEEVEDTMTEREEELRSALGVTEKFQDAYDSIIAWIPLAEQHFGTMKPPSTDPRMLRNQMEELNAFKVQVHPNIKEVESLNQHLATLKDTSPIAAEAVLKPVHDINNRWAELIRGISDRQHALNEASLNSGELTTAMEQVVDSLRQADKDVADIDPGFADSKCIESRLKRLQLVQGDIRTQDAAGKRLCKAVDDFARAVGQSDPKLESKKHEMQDTLRESKINAVGKQNELQETLREVKKFVGEIDDLLQWVNDMRLEIKSPPPLGALPETAQKQIEKAKKRFEELKNKEKSIDDVMDKADDILKKCKPEEATHMTEKLKKLRDRWNDVSGKAKRRNDKLDEHLRNVGEFHETLKGFTEWLINAEMTLRGFVYPSKIVEKVVKQKQDHSAFKADVLSHAEMMEVLDHTGTYLKYFGRKQDTIYIKNLLVGIRLRWKKLVRRIDDRGRLLQQAYKEDKKFNDAWKNLSDWLTENERKLNRILSVTQSPNKVQQDIDDIKESPRSNGGEGTEASDLKQFQHQLANKHSDYYFTTRLGRNLKDRCTKTDVDREILQGMLDDLKNKWNAVRSIVSKSQNKLDEALLSSGRVSDAFNSLVEWLHKTETALAPNQPILGDADTVNILIEQHSALQQELVARESTICTMKASGEMSKSQTEEITSLWDRVNHLADVRENSLLNSLKLAEEFQEVVQIMREFLPLAESELKIKGLPEDEMAIIQLIERHEKFQEDLRAHQDHVDKIKSLAEDILHNCHPNAVRFVKYYLTITQTRWDQLLARAKSRAERLQEALRSIQGNAALLEDLLQWLTDAQVLLATKEKDPLPEDLNVVEELLQEHLELHHEVTSKNSDVDRLTKVVSSEFAKYSQGKNYGSNWKLNEIDQGQNPRVMALQNKWRTVWRMSVDRKKTLQDALDQLIELESFKNFDFELWRQRYVNWIAAKKFRISDFFRRQDKDMDGYLSRDEFVSGMLQSKFPSNRTELNAVLDMFDIGGGFMEYKEFIDALRPEKHRRARTGLRTVATDSELIHEEIEKSTSYCQCRRPFRADKIDEGKYKFGDNQVKLVRFLNSSVMVRVGGGWVTLDKFLEQNDPCRAKGRTNFELREKYLSPDGYSASRTISTPRRGNFRSSTPNLSRTNNNNNPKKQTDTGYASSNSSASSSGNLSAARREKMTMSMINLSDNPHTHKNSYFGSTTSLSRSKRISTSSSHIGPQSARSPRPAPPARSPVGRPTTPSYGGRPKTPSYNEYGRPTTPSFGPPHPRSPATPNNYGPRGTPTPPRSTTPTPPNSARFAASRRPTTPGPPPKWR